MANSMAVSPAYLTLRSYLMNLSIELATMLIAGHDTTSVATTWGLWELAKPAHLAIQARLRDEVLEVGQDRPSVEELDALPYLDGIVKEIIRLHPSIESTFRCAAKDDVIPVSKPYVDRD